MTIDWIKFIGAMVLTFVLTAIVALCFIAVSHAQPEWQPDNVCGNEPVFSLTRERILICNNISYKGCHILYPNGVAPAQQDRGVDRPLGHPYSDQRVLAMSEYQRSKQGCREARSNLDDDTAFLYQQDMMYWQVRLAAAGAYGVELAEPYQAMGEQVLIDSVFKAIQNLILLEGLYRLPNLDLKDTRGANE